MVTKSCGYDKEKLVNYLIETNNKSWKKTILQLIDMLDATDRALSESQFQLLNTQNELYSLKIELNMHIAPQPCSWLKDVIGASEAFFKEDPKVVVPTVSDDDTTEGNTTEVHVERLLGLPFDNSNDNKVTPF